jgi:hypothetical protein
VIFLENIEDIQQILQKDYAPSMIKDDKKRQTSVDSVSSSSSDDESSCSDSS